MNLIISSPTRISADTLINHGSTLLTGVSFDVSVAGGQVDLYDGNDANSGSLKLRLTGTTNSPNSFTPASPILFDRGLYVDLGSNVTAVTILWTSAEGRVFRETIRETP